MPRYEPDARPRDINVNLWCDPDATTLGPAVYVFFFLYIFFYLFFFFLGGVASNAVKYYAVNSTNEPEQLALRQAFVLLTYATFFSRFVLMSTFVYNI